MDDDTLARYEQAQSIMQGWHTSQLAGNDAVFPHWIDNTHCFWYLRDTSNGKEFRLVCAPEATNKPAFDHQALANLLTKITGQTVAPDNLPIRNVSMILTPLRVHFQCFDKYWCYDTDTENCEEREAESPRIDLKSPDGKKAIFVHEYNLWLRDQASGKEQALTHNGTKDYSYANTLLGMDSSIQALWSPDSTRLLTVQLDTREVTTRPLISYVPMDGNIHPTLNELKLAYPGDKHVESYRLVAIDTSTGECQPADYPSLPYVQHGSLCDGFFTGNLGWWSPDNRHAFFIDMSRGSKSACVVKLDTYTGRTQLLFEENSSTYIRICEDIFSPPVFLPLPDTKELIWFSERSGWAHLYLYDLDTGKLKHSITKGEWLVRGVLHFDTQQRELIIQTGARDSSVNPYYRDICKVNIDSGNLTSLISGCFDHMVYFPKHFCIGCRTALKIDARDVHGVSPCGQYVVTTYSRVDTPPVSVLIDRNGNNILKLETADVSGLPAEWLWPEPVKLKAADDQTDIYGVVFRPPGYTPDNSYPVIDFLVGCRLLLTMPFGSFINQYIGTYYEMQALAALGFIVVGIAGRGTPYRDKSFQDHNFGSPGHDDDLTDHIAGLRQLASRYPYMDLERVGITCMEGAENLIYGPLDHPDFYKVTVSHYFGDPRFSVCPFEMFTGIVDNETLSQSSGPEDYVESFSGKLLLIHGVLTIGSEPMFRLVEALQKANKNFDMLCLPNLAMQISSYGRRRGWDYFVTHLQGIEPPSEFQLTTSEDILAKIADHSVAEVMTDIMNSNTSITSQTPELC